MGDPPAPLPALGVGVLSEAQLGALVDDLLGVTELLDVIEKAAPGALADPRSVDLCAAVARLQRAEVHAVQVRYRWQGEQWCDTLLPGPGGVRLVRARMAEMGLAPLTPPVPVPGR